MAMRFTAWITCLLCCVTTTQTLANDFLNPTTSYIAVSAGKSKSADTCTTTLVAGSSCSETGNVYRFAYGYRFTPNFGVQISYGDFGTTKETGTLPSTPSGVPGSGPIPYTWVWDAVGWELAGTVTLNMGEMISVFGKAGVLRANVGEETTVLTSTNEIWHAVIHDDSNGTSVGAGMEIHFNRDFGLRLQYERFGKLGKVNPIKVNAASAALLLKF